MATLTISAGDVPTAAQFNSFMTHTGAAWGTWSPTVAQGASPAVATNRGSYFQAGRLIIASAYVTVSSGAGTALNGIAVTIPVTAASYPTDSVVGSGWILDVSASAYYPCVAKITSTTTISFFTTTTNTNVSAGQTGSAMTAALAVGDSISFTVQYESATG